MSELCNEACPGGVPGVTAGICPQPGFWIHAVDQAVVPQLIRCENAKSCLVDKNCSYGGLATRRTLQPTTLAKVDLMLEPAICGEGYDGFLCGQCQDGWTKVAGRCIECPGFSWGMMATQACTR
jgi:hypothetical protein